MNLVLYNKKSNRIMDIVYAKIRNTIWYQTLKVNVRFEMKI